MLRNIWLACCWCCVAAGAGWAQTPLQRAVQALAADPGLRGSVVGIHVIDVASGEELASHQADLALIPASTQKLITTAAALHYLGPDHRFTTRLRAVGEIRDGVLHGDLYLIGGGDPSLGSPYLEGVPGRRELTARWVAAARKAGIRSVTGRVVGDGSYYGTDGVSAEWPWSDLGNYYGAGAYGLNFHENFYFLDFNQRPGVGERPLLRGPRPRVEGLRLHNELRSGPPGSGDQAYIYGAPFGNDYFVRGSIPAGSGKFTIKGSLPDPALFAAQHLQAALGEAGIAVRLPAATDRTMGAAAFRAGLLLDEYRSPPLSRLVDRTNLRSNNLYAEALLREINKAYAREAHELASTTLITNWLGEELGLDTAPVQLLDGSGLATRNFLSARFMTAFLRTQAGKPGFVRSIPLSGRTGNMRRFLAGKATAGRVYAKSGSLNGVRCYAGYVEHPGGRRAFAVMVNNTTAEGRELRRAIFRVLEIMVR